MTSTKSPARPVIADPMSNRALLATLPIPAAKPRKPLTAADYRKKVDAAIITAAGQLVTDLVPEEMRATVAQLIANQLHHMTTPALGWPSAVLPVPARSDWR